MSVVRNKWWWKKYPPCKTCNAQAGQPCHDLRLRDGEESIKRAPHPGRRWKRILKESQ